MAAMTGELSLNWGCTKHCYVEISLPFLPAHTNHVPCVAGLYFTRASWLPKFGRVIPANTYQKVNPSFGDDIEAGLRYYTSNVRH